MNRPQKKLLNKFIFILVITVGFVVFMVNVRNTVNRSETVRSLGILGREVLEYRRNYGSLPSESYIKVVREKFGIARLGDIHYRAQWIEFGADADSTILAYTTRPFRRIFEKYYVVLWLDGRVEQYRKADFEKILNRQQNEFELKWLRENILQKPQTPFEPGLF